MTLFRERHPAQTPDEWISRTENTRDNLHAEKVRLIAEVSAWRNDLENFDKYALADDRVYAKALSALSAAKIPFQRLHAVIRATSDGPRQASLLTLFSSALSAPVLKIEDAQAATQLLEQQHVTVPVFLSGPFAHFVSSGEITDFGGLSHTILVGRRTRQVEMLLNPNLIKEEKAFIEEKIKKHQVRQNEIDVELKDIGEGSELVAEALRAKKAISRNAESQLKQAQQELAQLNAALKAIERRASKDSLAAVAARIAIAKKGGAPALQEVTQKIIPALETEIKQLAEQIIVLEQQSSEDALHALRNMKRHKAEGGEERYSQLTHQMFLLEPEIESLKIALDDVTQKIESELEGRLNSADQLLAVHLQTYGKEREELEKAIEFEEEDFHIVMLGADDRRKELQASVSTLTSRLVNINFERAARYVTDNKTIDRSVADRIAEAKAKKNEAARIIDETQAKIVEINGQLSTITPYLELLHELAFEIIEKASKLSNFSDDIRSRMHSEMGSHPELQKYGEIIRLACMGVAPGTSQTVMVAIGNLCSGVSSLDIDAKHLTSLKNMQRSTQREFREKRVEFCEKARRKEINGLHELEIAKIEAANTVEELAEIQALRDLIDKTIDERKTELHKAKELANASKDASIDNMTRFARVAERNLKLLDNVMKKSPRARFFIEAQVADEEHIRKVVESLLADIEDRERLAHERASAPTNNDLARRQRGYRELIQEMVYQKIFINPKVDFSHAGMWEGDRKAFNDKLSMGQKTALHLMWLIKQAEFSLLRAAYQFGTKKERDASLRNSQHILFFDGLFSNLSNEKIINEAFEGLKYVGDAFQLIGLIHNTRYVNNKDIFPVHLIGRRFRKAHDENEGVRGFVTIEPSQTPGDMGMFTSIFKKNPGDMEPTTHETE